MIKLILLFFFVGYQLNPDLVSAEILPELVPYYSENKANIDRLREKTLNSSATVDERIDAFNMLRAKYNLVVPDVASTILSSSEIPEKLSILAANTLAANSVMSDHMLGFKKGYRMTSSQQVAQSQHLKILASLDKAVFHKNKEVRSIAAKTGGTLSYTPIIQSVVNASNLGLFSGKEVVEIIEYSKSDIAIPIITKYLNSPETNLETKIAALSLAGKFEATHAKVIEYATNREISQPLRIAAINAMTGDAKATNILIAISLDSSEPSEIAKQAAQSYAKTVTLQPNKFSKSEIDSMERALKSASSVRGSDNAIFFNSIRMLEKSKGVKE
ncbi:hypothetical protein C8R32_10996 [Nitrosospira sp. Nsp5]|uniref:HEAT repeat protein n=1 Tax=Nitrosospira multiformis TaxID=1231 RepID=A0ABY0TNC7_9PROT|nr:MULTISPECIES: hypothetical protein [Nitrosospira]PTR06810.1 hypothetical protein C8R32_10996 [Nitrosospira sp. Nsp5]SDQ88814.1 hypothetical protein SAMN05216402_2694 [Nitrosospira multiformis]